MKNDGIHEMTDEEWVQSKTEMDLKFKAMEHELEMAKIDIEAKKAVVRIADALELLVSCIKEGKAIATYDINE